MLLLVAHRHVEDRLGLVGLVVMGEAALDARHHLVLEADVGEGAAHHHLVVAAPRAVLVEVLGLDAVLSQVGAGRAVLLDRAGGRDVVGRDRIAELAERPGTLDVGEPARDLAHAVEVGRIAHVGRLVVPRIGQAGLGLDAAPELVALEHVGVALLEGLDGDELVDQLLDFHVRWPDVLEVDRLAVLADADRILGDIDLHRAGQRVAHHQHRRGEIVGPGQWVDATLEVAVARQHGADHEIGIGDRLGYRIGQRA